MLRTVQFLLLSVALVHCAGWAAAAGESAYFEHDTLETLFTGGVLTEGAAAAPDGTIYFSDITFTRTAGMQAGHIMKYDPKTGEVSVYRSPSGMSNGIKFDAQGNMIVAEGADFGGRRVTRTDMKTGKSVIIGNFYNGRQFNAPNDISIDLKGRIYFSDPRYVGHEPMEQGVMAVYRIDPDGSIHQIITDAGKPNGVCVSPDQKTLYVVSNDNGNFDIFQFSADLPFHKGRMALLAYDLSPEGTAKFRKTLADYYPQDGPDGLVVDAAGNLYVAVRDQTRPGIYVYSPEGKELDYLRTPDLPTNVGFGRGNEIKTLYITSGDKLQRVRTKKAGISFALPVEPDGPWEKFRAALGPLNSTCPGPATMANPEQEIRLEQTQVVTEPVCVGFMGPGVQPVLSTPSLIMWLEMASRQAAAPLLGQDEETVGTAMDLKHLAPTPLGMKVTLKTRIVEVAGRRIRFELEAFDEVEKIAEGWHERARVSVPRFASYLESKRPQRP